MNKNPYQAPSSELAPPNSEDAQYAGFWLRVAASLIDGVLLALLTLPPLAGIYGGEYFTSEEFIMGAWDVILSWVLPAVLIILFWVYRGATPGKMSLKLRIVDAQTGAKPSFGQCVGRYFAYIPAALPIMLGIVWVAVSPRKQGWHDILAGTVVVVDP